MLNARLLERELEPRIEEVRRGYQSALLTLATSMGSDLAPTADILRPEEKLEFGSANYDLQSEISAALARRADIKLARTLVPGCGGRSKE